jgi:phage regulator Rha-like protein
MDKEINIPDEVLMNKIYVVREQKVMLDRDLAELYGVETRVLKQAVRRNLNRFPEDFMFEMEPQEFEIWRSQFVTSTSDQRGLRYAPFCFTEQGMTMLSCLLNSQRAIVVNIRIIRLFTKMRQIILTHKDLLIDMEEIRQKVASQDDKIELIFDYLTKFVTQNEKDNTIKKVGFRQKNQ